IIAATPDVTATDIAKSMAVSNQFVASETAKLVARNIVERKVNPADRRSMFLSLGPKGRDLLRELGPLRRDSNDLMYRSLTGDRARMLQETMDALIVDAGIALHELTAPHRTGQKAPTAAKGTNERKAAIRRGRSSRKK